MHRELTEIEIVIRDALLTINSVVSRPGPRYKSNYPNEYLMIISPQEPRNNYVGDIDHADVVICEWFHTGCLSTEERKIIMMRLGSRKIRSYSSMSKTFKSSRELIRQKYHRALIILEADLRRKGLYDEKLCQQIAELACSTEFF